MKKSAVTHAIAFSLGLGTGAILVTKGCPPTPAPAGQPAKEEPKIEAKTETKADAKPEVQ